MLQRSASRRGKPYARPRKAGLDGETDVELQLREVDAGSFRPSGNVDSGTVAGVVFVAAPIFGADGHVAAALSIGGPSARIGLHLRALESAVYDGGEEISGVLGYCGERPTAR